MSNCLIIADLQYLGCSEEAEIMGGYVFTTANTSAGLGTADAAAAAFASGQQTYTNTQTVTLVRNYSDSSYSYAAASANAFAQNTYIEQSRYQSTSIYYSGH